MGDASFPYRRLADPLRVPAVDLASKVNVPVDRLRKAGVTSAYIVNSYPVWVRLKGHREVDLDPSVVGAHDGLLLPPGSAQVFSATFPLWLSAMAVDRPGFPLRGVDGELLFPDAEIEVTYGGGA